MESTCNLTFDFRKKRSEKAINTVNVLINAPGALHFPKGGGLLLGPNISLYRIFRRIYKVGQTI